MSYLPYHRPTLFRTYYFIGLGVTVFNTIFNNISIFISWRSILLVQETGVAGQMPMTICITYCCIESTSPEMVSKSKHQWRQVLIAYQIFVNPTTIRSRPRRSLSFLVLAIMVFKATFKNISATSWRSVVAKYIYQSIYKTG